jgi:DNA-binding NarL/FixJ family response regulator
MFVDGLRNYTSRVTDLSVVGMAMTGEDAIAQAVQHRPDVAVVNIELPGVDGATVTRRIALDVRVLVVSDLDKEEHLGAAMAAGASGYVTKNADPEDILTAIRVVARGGLYANKAVAQRIRRRLSEQVTVFPHLTVREREVLELLAVDTGVNAIAGSLGITRKTVGRHMTSIMAKLPAETPDDAVRMARAARL